MTRQAVFLSAAEADDLAWYLQRDYEGDVGLRSNLGPAAAQLEYRAHVRRKGGWGEVLVSSHANVGRRIDIDDDVLEAGTRLRRIEHRWRQLDGRSQRILLVRFGHAQVLSAAWGEGRDIVIGTHAAHEAHRVSRTGHPLVPWLLRLPSRPAHTALVTELRHRGEEVFAEAVAAWRRTRPLPRSVRRVA